MITREVGDHYRLTTLADHAATAGYLAAHWGNEEFFRPEGCSHPSQYKQKFREDLITAVTQHQIGWQDWEVKLETNGATGLPIDFMDLPQNDALEFWRSGVAHFAEDQPYVALLISLHAYWLLAHECDPSMDPTFLHPLVRSAERTALQAREAERKIACEFLRERAMEQNRLVEELRQDDKRRGWIAPRTLEPAVRLLQVVDAISLRLCFGEEVPLTLLDVPRRGWADRVRIQIRPEGNRRIAVSPYPFDEEPLLVPLKTREIRKGDSQPREGSRKWQSAPSDTVFEFNSRPREAAGEPKSGSGSDRSRVSWLTSSNGA